MAALKSHYRVVMIGLGRVARTHVKVLELQQNVEIIAGVDISNSTTLTFRGKELPVYLEIKEAGDLHQPDLVVIATPTPTHAEVCVEAARCFPDARLLVEKPVADNLSTALHVLEEFGACRRLDVAYHMAHSPEVTWGLEMVRTRGDDLGSPVQVLASFSDPYSDNYREKAAALCNSWVDSGINSLSILANFVTVTAVRSLRRMGEDNWSIFSAELDCKHVDNLLAGTIITSWHVSDTSKTTRILYDSGSQLLLDHNAVAGYLIEGNSVTEIFGSDQQLSRSEQRYRALYRGLLANDKPALSHSTSVHLHHLLFPS